MINWSELSKPHLSPDTIYSATGLMKQLRDKKTDLKTCYGWMEIMFMVDWEDAYTSDTEVDIERTPAIY
tara:strand:- start:2098 stop:2304 length:207 start_codon:yes stop_codon:yes gene_type:complete